MGLSSAPSYIPFEIIVKEEEKFFFLGGGGWHIKIYVILNLNLIFFILLVWLRLKYLVDKSKNGNRLLFAIWLAFFILYSAMWRNRCLKILKNIVPKNAEMFCPYAYFESSFWTTRDLMLSLFTLKISLVILLTVSLTILMMLPRRIWYWIN